MPQEKQFGGQLPDYAVVHDSVVEEFVSQAKIALREMYGDAPSKSPDYSRLINAKAVNRLADMIKDQPVVAGGEYNEAERYFAPTIIYPVNWHSPIMQDEIFGPLLPIITYSSLEDTISRIKDLPKPLAAYIFSTKQTNIEYILNALSFGGGAVNQVNIHLFIGTMPFGGVGNSGIGNYYGKYGFDPLTHAKSVLHAPSGQVIEHLIPPYTMEKIQELSKWGEY